MRQVFIVGTDTGVGKTLVTAGLFRSLLRHEQNVAVMKPVQTGVPPARRREESDLAQVAWAVGLRLTDSTLDAWMPYCFPTACSPHLAARLGKATIDFDRLVAAARDLAARYDYLLVEGAGGLLVPLDEKRTLLDLAKKLGWPVLVVAHNRLGAINHTLLTLRALRSARLRVAGVVFNHVSRTTQRDVVILDENIAAVVRLGKVSVVAHLPHVPRKWDVRGAAWRTLDPLFDQLAVKLFGE